MTNKQEEILLTALELFARDGFRATSTSKVAKHAGVSEDLGVGVKAIPAVKFLT